MKAADKHLADLARSIPSQPQRQHFGKERRDVCQTFSTTTGTIFYRRQKEAELLERVVTLLAHSCPVPAIVVAFRLDERTVRDWLDDSGQHCQTVHEHLVERPCPLGQAQADELRVKAQGLVIWVARVIQVQTWLWRCPRLNVELSPDWVPGKRK